MERQKTEVSNEESKYKWRTEDGRWKGKGFGRSQDKVREWKTEDGRQK